MPLEWDILMGLQHYRDRMCDVVCAMAKRRTYNDRLHTAWSLYLYRMNWEELESLLPAEDHAALQKLKKCMRDEMKAEVKMRRRQISERFGDPETEEEKASFLSRYNYEYAIKALSPIKAKRFVASIVDFYLVLVIRVDLEAQLNSPGQRTSRLPNV